MREFLRYLRPTLPDLGNIIIISTVSVVLITFFLKFGAANTPRVDPQIVGDGSEAVTTDAVHSQPSVISSADQNCKETTTIDVLYYPNKDPLWEKNNKFGMYIYAEVDAFLELSQNLVNSSGGEWGYVLIPFNVKDTNEERWNKIFTKVYEKRLIPIISLHDIDPEDYREQTRKAAQFLNKFVWPIRYRYVTVYNEPNDANFWYGRVDPSEYARILDYTVDTFKQVNSDYFMLNGAFNVSAATTATSLDSFDYMRKMEEAVPGVFSKLDGWASHAYPQPNFSGHPRHTGRWSIRAYEDELEFLEKELDVEKELPVFITETGWMHAEGESYNGGYVTSRQVGEYFRIAFEEVWLKDDRVRAVIPFTIWYEPPFDHFSWVNRDRVPYEQYEMVKNIKKVAGEPPVYSYRTVQGNICN